MRSPSLIDLLTLSAIPGIWKDSPGTAIVVAVACIATIHAPIAAMIWLALRA